MPHNFKVGGNTKNYQSQNIAKNLEILAKKKPFVTLLKFVENSRLTDEVLEKSNLKFLDLKNQKLQTINNKKYTNLLKVEYYNKLYCFYAFDEEIIGLGHIYIWEKSTPASLANIGYGHDVDSYLKWQAIKTYEKKCMHNN
jgi:hypothetical protein